MLIKNPRFEISAVKPSQYPKGNLPEVVLAGKSNVRSEHHTVSLLLCGT